MLPRLQAEEQLARIDAAALSGGMVDSGARMDAIAQLQRIAEPQRKAARPSPAMLAMMGIAVSEIGENNG